MKRFVDLGSQLWLGDEEWNFAWYCTVVDRFEKFGDNQVWESWDEFEADYIYEKGFLYVTGDIDRYWRLFPKDKK